MSNKKSNVELSVTNVADNYNYFFNLLLNRIVNMFTIKGDIPDTVDEDFLKVNTLLHGYTPIFKHNDKLYCCNCSIGGEPNEYYYPTKAIISNPVIGSKEFKIDEECTILWNSTADKLNTNSFFINSKICPTYALIDKTAALLAENISSLAIAQINTRLSVLVTAPTETIRKSAEIMLKRIYNGEPWVALTDNDLMNDIKVWNIDNQTKGVLTEIIETQQYLLAQFFHAIGINSNFNMKREKLITSEIEVNNDSLQINIKDMLETRQKCANKINKMFALNWHFDLSDEWKLIYNNNQQKEGEKNVIQNNASVSNSDDN